jgi:predicted PurR-regulated permease PerM
VVKQTDQVMDEIEAITTDLDSLLAQVKSFRCTMTKQLVGFGTAVMTTLLALVVLWQFRIVVVYVLISLTLAAALRPLVNRLVGRGFVVRVAWILLYLVVLGSFGFLLFLTGETAINEIQQLANCLSVQDEWRLPVWLEGSSFQQALVARLPPPSKLFEAFTGDQGQLVLPAILGFTQGIGGVVSGCIHHSVLEHLLEHQSNSF